MSTVKAMSSVSLVNGWCQRQTHLKRGSQGSRGSRRSRGVSLLEVLISVLVLSLGMLGAAALQANALRGSQGSWERTQVAVLTQSIFDGMRANLGGLSGGGYVTGGWVCAAPAAGTLAASDVSRWVTNLQAQINPSACGRIACAGRTCTVGVRWDDSRLRGGNAAQVLEMQVQL